MTDSLNPLLSIKNLNLSFRSDRGFLPILCGVDLTINHGESLALVGESGSGKSVTALAIMQLLGNRGKITNGEIIFAGIPLHSKNSGEMRAIRGKKIGMVFQDPMTSLNPTLSIGWQIAEMLIVHEHLSKKLARAGAIELLKKMGISDAKHRYDAYPFQLSGGMRQRSLIAMALACQPILLIADEPTTALDVTVQAQILDLLKTIQQETGMSLLLITHDLAIVANICDRVAIIHHGKVIETNGVDQLFKTPKHPYTCALLEAGHRNIYNDS